MTFTTNPIKNAKYIESWNKEKQYIKDEYIMLGDYNSDTWEAYQSLKDNMNEHPKKSNSWYLVGHSPKRLVVDI